jgi:hypothetical protein
VIRPSGSTPTIASGADSSSPRKRASARCCSVTSRETDATPAIRPALSRIGDSVSETVIGVPSMRNRSVWYCSTRSPAAIRASSRGSSCRPGGKSTAALPPITSLSA